MALTSDNKDKKPHWWLKHQEYAHTIKEWKYGNIVYKPDDLGYMHFPSEEVRKEFIKFKQEVIKNEEV